MRVLVTGGTGMLGSSFENFTKNTFLISSKDYDLRNENEVKKMFEEIKPEIVVHAAARCGGVLANLKYMADFYHDNILMNTFILKYSLQFSVKTTISILSSCAYPNESLFPLTEETFHNGEPFSSHYSYAYTKRMLDIQNRAIKQQYGVRFFSVIPNNLYGFNDNFDLQNSHVVPALIRKIYEAKIKNTNVVLWGDGTPLREFTFSKDIPNICKFLIKNYKKCEPINIGNTEEISINSLASLIADELEFKNKIIWDSTKPNGQLRKPTSNQKLLNLGWSKKDYTKLNYGIKKTCEWFVHNYPNIRGIN